MRNRLFKLTIILLWIIGGSANILSFSALGYDVAKYYHPNIGLVEFPVQFPIDAEAENSIQFNLRRNFSDKFDKEHLFEIERRIINGLFDPTPEKSVTYISLLEFTTFDARLGIRGRKNTDVSYLIEIEVEYEFRKDILIIFFGINFGIFLSLYIVHNLSTSSTQIDGDFQPESIDESESPERIIRSLFDETIGFTKEKYRLAYLRANIFLASGVVIGFFGVLVFGIMAGKPEISDFIINGKINYYDYFLSFLIQSTRPVFTFIFIEGVAWFFLSQYKILNSEQRDYYHAYTDRVDQKISFEIIKWQIKSPSPHKQWSVFLNNIRKDQDNLDNREYTNESKEITNPLFRILSSILKPIESLSHNK